MKRFILILIPVLLLALTLIYRGNQAPQPTENAKPVPIRDPKRGDGKAQLKPEPEVQRFSWREVESADYPQYVANLRRINVPELTVTDIIVADVNRLFAERAMKLKADRKEASELKFWQIISVGTTNRVGTMRLGSEMRALNQERIRLIKELLGKEITDPLVLQKPDAFNIEAPPSIYSLDFLPEPKRRAFNALHAAACAEMRASTPDEADDDHSIRLRLAVWKKYDPEVAKILSPAEKLEYDARYSNAAQNLRHTLYGMQPTPEEFLQIVALRRRYFDEYESYFAEEDPAILPDQFKAKRAMNAQLEQALGTERFQQLQRGLDIGYGYDTRFLTGLGLNQETANELYRLRAGLRTGAVLNESPVVATQNLEAAKAATIRLLGEEAFRRYTTLREGSWLTGVPNSLAPIREILVRAVKNN